MLTLYQPKSTEPKLCTGAHASFTWMDLRERCERFGLECGAAAGGITRAGTCSEWAKLTALFKECLAACGSELADKVGHLYDPCWEMEMQKKSRLAKLGGSTLAREPPALHSDT